MNIEVNPASSDVERRARLHAALAEPARLRILDRLGLGDATPGELQRLLSMPSNLLAHHLKVLELDGLVQRHRSQGDQRRFYVQLVPETLTGLFDGLGSTIRASRVVFVCTANTARSQLAVALWSRASTVPATSAGTHPADRVAPGAVAAARRRRLPLQQVRPRALNDVLDADDYIVTVCDNAHEELHRTQAAGLRTAHWSVPDPVRLGTPAAFDAACDDLSARVATLVPRLTAN